jgi:hypothetical protein
MSEFIERSKHPAMTKAFSDVMEMERGAYNKRSALPPQPIHPPFGHPNTGVGYRPDDWAGTTPEMTNKYR